MHARELPTTAQGCQRLPTPLLRRRAALWRTLFWQPLLRGSGFYLVTFLLLAAALWASLHAPPLWQLLRWAFPAAMQGEPRRPGA